ncbi:hypothetical protein B0H12DRAFT_1275783 [Mycena haematopus]|nr:hypothetical protein B0H12DRAFT_1275783 [Mycena haematopus]
MVIAYRWTPLHLYLLPNPSKRPLRAGRTGPARPETLGPPSTDGSTRPVDKNGRLFDGRPRLTDGLKPYFYTTSSWIHSVSLIPHMCQQFAPHVFDSRLTDIRPIAATRVRMIGIKEMVFNTREQEPLMVDPQGLWPSHMTLWWVTRTAHGAGSGGGAIKMRGVELPATETGSILSLVPSSHPPHPLTLAPRSAVKHPSAASGSTHCFHGVMSIPLVKPSEYHQYLVEDQDAVRLVLVLRAYFWELRSLGGVAQGGVTAQLSGAGTEVSVTGDGGPDVRRWWREAEVRAAMGLMRRWGATESPVCVQWCDVQQSVAGRACRRPRERRAAESLRALHGMTPHGAGASNIVDIGLVLAGSSGLICEGRIDTDVDLVEQRRSM